MQKRQRSKSRALLCCFCCYFNAKSSTIKAISIGGSNNTGGLGAQFLTAGSQWGLGALPLTLRRFYSFLYKKFTFLRHILVYISA